MAYTDNDNQDLQPINPEFQINSGDLEGLLDVIAEAIILSGVITSDIVESNQKFIRDGLIKIGKIPDGSSISAGTLALYQKDVEANIEDDLQSIADDIISPFDVIVDMGVDDTISVQILGGGLLNGGITITDLIVGDDNPLNVSQFIPIQKQKSVVDITKAEEYLDTNIYELIPSGDERQNRIIKFFQELNTLLPPQLPSFDTNGDGYVDRDEDSNWTGAEQYSQDNSISYSQQYTDGNIDEEDAFIHRLKDTANDTNQSLTIEDIYKTIQPYLTDILEDPVDLQDDRTEYQNQSSGYLQFRNPNQGIIIRNTNQDFVEGLNPNNLTYLDTGFTITMWVRFLDKVSEGTLFNFGNPTRLENPFGFKLETYVLEKDGVNPHANHTTWGTGAEAAGPPISNYFQDSNTARFVRLVVRDKVNDENPNGAIRDSHIGGGGSKIGPSTEFVENNIPYLNYPEQGDSSVQFRLLQTTFIPEDFQEWYFICASFNPNIDEDGSDFENYGYNRDYWLNHIDASEFNPDWDDFVVNSGKGNRCKVEIISRTDLLRARGFKVD